MPAGSICGSRVRYAGYGRRLTCAVPGYCSQCRPVTTSTIVKRRWHVLRMLSGAIPSTWALALAFSFYRDCVTCSRLVTKLQVDLGLAYLPQRYSKTSFYVELNSRLQLLSPSLGPTVCLYSFRLFNCFLSRHC